MAVRKTEIKMRTCKDVSAKCQVCGCTKDKSLELFEICFPGSPANQIICLCDLCNEQLLSKTLKATCQVHEKVKSNHDMEIIRSRYKYSGKCDV